MMKHQVFKIVVCALTSLAMTAAVQAATVTVHIKNVKNSEGHLVAALCGEKAKFVNGCFTYRAQPAAHAGTVDAIFENVADGVYAFSSWHDANDNVKVDIPDEGFAYGNNTGFPPTFEGASLKVAGDTESEVTLTYLGAGPTSGAVSSQSSTKAQSILPAIKLHEEGLVGEFYAEPNGKNLPALLVLGGSEGGMGLARSMGISFVEKGYAVLVLAYFHEEGLPNSLREIPLEYFEKGIAWLGAQKQVDKNHLGIIGISKGAEAALLVAARDKDIKAVIAVSPSFVVWPDLEYNPKIPDSSSWSWEGKPLPYVPLDTTGYKPTDPFTEMFKHTLASTAIAEAAIIPVERINGPVLLLSGGGDRILPSGDMAERVMARLDANHFKYPHSHIDYPDAGHFVYLGQGVDPATYLSFGGGKIDAARKAVSESWTEALAFFDKALKH